MGSQLATLTWCTTAFVYQQCLCSSISRTLKKIELLDFENMKISIQIAFLLSVICFVNLGSALKCHSFLPGDENLTEVECKPTDNTCNKVTLDGETSRGCDTKEQVGCNEKGSTQQCYCKGDLCNSAPSVSNSVSIVSFMASMLLYTLLN